MANSASLNDARIRDRHGRRAQWPSHIALRGWRDIVLGTIDDVVNTNVSLVAAGVAFFGFLAIPSAFSAVVALYGLAFNPADVQRQVDAMRGVVPDQAISLIADQLQSITAHSGSKLGIAFGVSIAVALWSVRSGMSSLMTALNIAYGETERRGLLSFQATALALTLGGTLFATVALALIALLPAVIGLLPLGEFGKGLASAVRWPVLLVLMIANLAALYRFGPSRQHARWRWVSWGAAVASMVWLVVSVLFSIYVTGFAAYDKTYGSLGGVVVLLMWLYLTCFAILLGAQLNAEIEHQTARDSTTGLPLPMGERGATMADTLGETR